MFGFKYSAIRLIVILLFLVQYYTFQSVVLWTIYVCSLIITVVYTISTYDQDYWVNRGVFSPPSWPVVGHILSVVLFKEQGGMCFKRIYDKYKNLKFLGTHQFQQRTLVVRDPALIKRICVNDFQHFTDRGFFFNKDVDPLAGSVLFLRGNEWRKLRAKISPIFSPNKLRGMIPLIVNTANEFAVRVETLLSNNLEDKHTKEINEIDDQTVDENRNSLGGAAKVVDSEKLVGGYTADAIVPCAFGLKSNVMYNDNDPFAVALQAFYKMSLYNIFEKTMRQFWPAFVLFFRMRIIPKKTHEFFFNIVTSVLRDRESGAQEKRGDFIDMMMALQTVDKNGTSKISEEDDVEITDIVISANAFIIFLGGFETTSSTLAFLMLELAANSEVQYKLRREIVQAMEKHQGLMTYELLQDLEYMEMVIQETLRLYPPFPSIQRMCTKDYLIPETEVTIQKGTIILFPTLGIQRDTQYFDSPEKFIPERWSSAISTLPPGVYMPFGDGPRYCIGKRFAMIQMKSCLVKLLPRVCLRPASAIPRDGPFRPDPRSPLTLHPANSDVILSLIDQHDLHRYC